jgi:hypothetical protein
MYAILSIMHRECFQSWPTRHELWWMGSVLVLLYMYNIFFQCKQDATEYIQYTYTTEYIQCTYTTEYIQCTYTTLWFSCKVTTCACLRCQKKFNTGQVWTCIELIYSFLKDEIVEMNGCKELYIDIYIEVIVLTVLLIGF